MSFWKGKCCLVTGGLGLWGGPLTLRLMEEGACVRLLDDESKGSWSWIKDHASVFDIECRICDMASLSAGHFSGQDYVFHLASKAWGVGWGRHWEQFAFNERLSLALFEALHKYPPKGLFLASSSCVYDDMNPMRESFGWEGSPEEANSGYGWAKRNLELMGRLYGEEHPDVRIVTARPSNIWGPSYTWRGREGAQVIPAFCDKIMREVKEGKPLEIWGSGLQVRNFLSADAAARAAVALMEKACGTLLGSITVNLAGEEDLTIGGIASSLAYAAGIGAMEVEYLLDKPTGRERKTPDRTRLERLLPGFDWGEKLQGAGAASMIEWWKREVGKC